MPINPSLEGLRAVSKFSVDSQWLLKNHLGEKVFSYQGDITMDFQNDCAKLLEIINDTKSDLDNMVAQIPVLTNK